MADRVMKKKSFPCNYPGCSKRYTRYHDMLRHLRADHKQEKYVCGNGYDEFSRLPYLRRHQQSYCKMKQEAAARSIIHTPVDFKCSACDQSLPTLEEFINHLKYSHVSAGEPNQSELEYSISTAATGQPSPISDISDIKPSFDDQMSTTELHQESVMFPDDEKKGSFGYCISYDQLPRGTWLKLDWLEKDEEQYMMGLHSRDNEHYQLWVYPRILRGLQKYRELLNGEESFKNKNIFFKYFGKKSEGSKPSFHDYQLIIH